MSHFTLKAHNPTISTPLSSVVLKILLVMLFCIQITYSQGATYRGIVKDSTTLEPLEGVTVECNNGLPSTTTDNTGNFIINPTVNIASPLQDSKQAAYYLRNGRLFLSLPEKSVITLKLFSLTGKTLYSFSGTWEPGSHMLLPHQFSSGIYLFMLETNNLRHVFKINITGNMQSAPRIQSGPNHLQQVVSRKIAKKQAAPADTLFFSKHGYFSKIVPVTATDSSLVVLLNPVNFIDGVHPGAMELVSAEGNTMIVYVNEDRTTIDSIVTTVRMNCVSTSEKFTFSNEGPITIPADGIISLGDSLQLYFSDSATEASFFTRQTIELTPSTKCQWMDTLSTPVRFYNVYRYLTTISDRSTIIRDPEREFYLPGDTVKLYIDHDSGYYAQIWTGDVDRTLKDTAWVIMNRSKTITATAATGIPLITSSDMGTIIRSPESAYYLPGDTVKLFSDHRSGYYIKEWGGVDSVYKDTAWVVMNELRTVAALAGTTIQLRLRFSNGSLIPDCDHEWFIPEYRDTVRVIALPDSGYRFAKWTGRILQSSGDTGYIVMDSLYRSTTGPVFISDKAIAVFEAEATSASLSVAISPDNATAALGMNDEVYLIDMRQGTLLRTIVNSRPIVNDICFSADGTKLLFSFMQNDCSLWDVERESILQTFTGNSCGQAVAFSPIDSVVLTGNYQCVDFWSVNTGAKIDSITGISGRAAVVSVSPDSRWLAVGSSGDSARVYSLSSKTQVTAIRGEIVCFAFTPSSDTLMALSNPSGDLLFIGLPDGTLLLQYSIKYSSHQAAFSPDGSLLAVGTWNRGIQVYNPRKGTLELDIPHSSPVQSMDFSPSGTTFLTGSGSTLVLWSVN